MSILEFIKGIDFFGKEPELYIQKRPKQVSIFGRIFIFLVSFLGLLGLGILIATLSEKLEFNQNEKKA